MAEDYAVLQVDAHQLLRTGEGKIITYPNLEAAKAEANEMNRITGSFYYVAVTISDHGEPTELQS